MKNKTFCTGSIFCLFLTVSFAAYAAKIQPILLVPVALNPSAYTPPQTPPLTELPYSNVSFRWKYQSPAEENLVKNVSFSLKKVDGYRKYACLNCEQGKEYVNLCKFNASSSYIGKRTSFNSLECNGGQLAKNQWYKWQVQLQVEGSQFNGAAEWFKTGDKEYRASIEVEFDKVFIYNWDWLTKGVPGNSLIGHGGKTYTFDSIYKTAGIEMQVSGDGLLGEEDRLFVDGDGKFRSRPYTDAELHSFVQEHKNGGQESVYVAVVSKRKKRPSFGKVFPPKDMIVGTTRFQRPAAAFVFSETIDDFLKPTHPIGGLITNISIEQAKLQTAAHEVGHFLSLSPEENTDNDAYEGPLCEHSGYCSGRILPPGNYYGTTIMTSFGSLDTTNWKYEWSPSSLMHFYAHPLLDWKPPAFGCHWYDIADQGSDGE